MKTGLVMEGGAMRGMFTAGVLDVFMEKGIDFDGAIGVSAGATFGCNIKSRQIGRTLRYNCKYSKNPHYGTVTSLFKTGDFYDAKFCYQTLPNLLDPFDAETFKNNPMEFYVVAADVETGKAVYHKCYDGLSNDLQWIRASASVPIVSNIVEVDGYKLLDGGIADSVPLQYFQSIGYKRNVVILTQSDSYRKQPNIFTPIAKRVYRNYPKFVEIFANRHDRYNANIEYIRQQERLGDTFVIRPMAKLELSNAEKDPKKLTAAYRLGREAAMAAIDERGLINWLSE